MPRFSSVSALLPALFCLLFAAAPARAQTYEFVGTIIDDVRGEPVGGVEIFMPDGRKRNSVRFSIIDEEWPTVKAGLEARLAR